MSGSFEVPDELIVRKITGRIGAVSVVGHTGGVVVISNATRWKRFEARATRIDSTLIAAGLSTRPTWGMPLTGCAMARQRRLGPQPAQRQRPPEDLHRLWNARLQLNT
jgi:hypothetical protein